MAESEFILLRRFSTSGDAEAFAQIIKQHAPMVYGVCLRILANRETAADVVQDTFFQLVRDAAEITGSLSNWLHKVATHRSIDLVRSDSQRKQREMKYAGNFENIYAKEIADEKALWNEISGYIDEELDDLDDQTREVLILRFFEGLTTTDIARKCNISQPTVSRRIESGIELLRLKLKSRGVIVPAVMFISILTENIVQAAPASVIKELGKIALSGGKVATGVKIAAEISAGIAIKTKIMVGILIVLLGAGMTVVSSFIANGEDKSASSYELVSKSLKNDSISDSNQSITASELLKRYVETQKKIRTSYLSKEEDKWEIETTRGDRPTLIKGKKYENFEKIELRSDSKNYYSSHKRWGDLPELQIKLVEDQVSETRGLWNEKSLFQYNDNPESAKALLWLTRKENININQIHYILDGQVGGPIRGFFIGSSELIDAELEHAESISVRPEKETINGSDCFVIDAKDERSEYVVWIDPEHGYNIAQAIVQRNTISFGDPSEYGGNARKGTSQVSLKNVVFKNIDGVWLPNECDYTIYNKYNNGEYTLENHHHKITEFSINPDHEALGSFDPNRFIKNGSRAQFTNIQGVIYLWQDGKVVDNYGYETILSTLKQGTLVGNKLPSIAEFGIQLNPDVFKNNRLLVCFFDYSKESSKKYILSLNKKVESLLDKDIHLIFIQTGTIDEQTLANWIRENEIVPPVGTRQIELSELGQYWTIKSLPWLILTDKNHIVTDQGFSIEKLDEEIETLDKK